MATIVKKFGGTSLATLPKIQAAAKRILSEQKPGDHTVVVTSAMAGVTDQLAQMAFQLSPENTAETDTVLTTGEQISAALFALALQRMGTKSRSWLAWQLPIETTPNGGRANITHINLTDLRAFMNEGGISVVAGFQGLASTGRLTTLGRGGSDITALALAAAFTQEPESPQPANCTIYTDVKGVFTADPHIVKGALKVDTISHACIKRLGQAGAAVLHPTSLLFASRANLSFTIAHHEHTSPGTTVTPNTNKTAHPFFIAAQPGWVRCVIKTSPGRALGLFLKDIAHTDKVCALSDRLFYIEGSTYRQNQDMLHDMEPQLGTAHGFDAITLLAEPGTDLSSISRQIEQTCGPQDAYTNTENQATFFAPSDLSAAIQNKIHNTLYQQTPSSLSKHYA